MGNLILIKSRKRLIEAAALVPLPNMARYFVEIYDYLLVWIWIKILLVRILINFSLSLLTFVSFLFGILEDSFILFIHLFFSVRLRLPISSLIFHFALLLFLIIFLDGIEGWYLIFYSLAIIFFVFSLPPLKKQVVLTVIFSLFNRDTLQILMDHHFWFLYGRKVYRLAWQF